MFSANNEHDNKKIIKLKFLHNVDPALSIQLEKKFRNKKEEILVIAVSKSFKTDETLQNLHLLQSLLKLSNKQIVTVSANPETWEVYKNFIQQKPYKVDLDITIPFQDSFKMSRFVGGRFSVSSVAGILPLSLGYGFESCQKLLDGFRQMDEHFLSELESPLDNIPVRLGLYDFYHFEKYGLRSKAVLPYCEGLSDFPAHIQQLEMESNGKDGKGFIVFGEAGTRGQHSFYQLLYEGQPCLCDFIGIKVQRFQKYKFLEKADFSVIEESYDKLYWNFLAQPKGLYEGNEKMRIKGKKPSYVINIEKLNERNLGILTAIYEHRVAVSGFLMKINSFDQPGVEVGKILFEEIKNAKKK